MRVTRRTDLLDEPGGRYVADNDNRPADAGPDFPRIWHLDGVPWTEAKLPRRLHRCRAQTIGDMDLHRHERCACGAMRVEPGPWVFRNESRRDRLKLATRKVRA